jgi:hypothetical protein
MARFLDVDDVAWGAPSVAADAGMIERVAAGEATHDEVVGWIRERTGQPGESRTSP